MFLLGFAAACTTYTDLSIDDQVDSTSGAGAAFGVSGDKDTSASSASTNTGGSATTTATTGSGGTGGDGAGSSDATATGGSATESSSGGSKGSDAASSSAATGGAASSLGGTGGTGGSDTTGGTGGTGGEADTGGAGGTSAGGASAGAGGVAGDGGASTGGATGAGGTSAATAFRYVRLVALTSQNAMPFTAVAELDLLDADGVTLDQSGWTASADSEETVDETAPASQAIDGDTDTFWHTEWGDYEAPLPHYLQIDLGSAQEITGFVYTPRQDGRQNGWILDWEFYLSNSASDPGTPVASGTFASGTTVQTVELP